MSSQDPKTPAVILWSLKFLHVECSVKKSMVSEQPKEGKIGKICALTGVGPTACSQKPRLGPRDAGGLKNGAKRCSLALLRHLLPFTL